MANITALIAHHTNVTAVPAYSPNGAAVFIEIDSNPNFYRADRLPLKRYRRGPLLSKCYRTYYLPPNSQRTRCVPSKHDRQGTCFTV